MKLEFINVTKRLLLWISHLKMLRPKLHVKTIIKWEKHGEKYIIKL